VATFNVLTETWLTAVDFDGREREYSLLELLAKAHQLRAIVDPSPPIQFGLYRFAITFVQDALRLVEFEDLEDALTEGQFHRETFKRYAETVGWQRFDLFDADTPFMQTRPVPGDAQNAKSVVELFYHLPTGTNVVHFFHMQEHEHAVAPPVAARALCSIAPFMTSGGAGYSPSINGTPPWYVLAVGRNLFETLLLNCCVMPISGLDHTTPSIWARDDSFTPRAEKGVRSLGEGFTWQPRQVRLLPSEGGTCTYTGRPSPVLIRQIVWGPGHKFGGQDQWLDPHVAYIHDDKRGTLPLRPRADRPLWRDYGPLFLLRHAQGSGHRSSRPLIVTQLARLKEERIIPRETAEQFEVYGMRVDKAKVFEWQYERLPLRTALLQNPEAGLQVQHALDMAEKVAKSLEVAVRQHAPRDGGGNPRALNGIFHHVSWQFWTLLHEFFEAEYLEKLAIQTPGDEHARLSLLDAWKAALRSIGWQCLDEASQLVGTSAEALRRQVLARNAFARNLAIALGDVSAKEGRKGMKRR